jgi:hypothetical protein
MAFLKRDVFAGLILVAFSLLLFFVLIPNQVDPQAGGPIALSPRLFCYVTAFLLLALSLNLTLSALRSDEKEEEQKGTSLLRATIAVVVAAAYVAGISILGYFTSTALALLFFLFFFGAKSMKSVLLFLLVMLPFIYLLFVKGLKVILPEGLII